MEIVFSGKDMIDFLEWYDCKEDGNETYEEELLEWISTQRSLTQNIKQKGEVLNG